MSCYMGLAIYAFYYKCDPITRGHISKSDQLLPYFVMHTSGGIPGLPGLFVSGVFSAALSSMSTGLNSMTGVIFEDLIKPYLKKPLTESQASFLMKVIVVIIGSICVGLVFIVEEIGSALIQTSKSLAAITAGPLLGIFSLGMFFPCANPTGALAGGIVSGILVSWISIGTHFKLKQGFIHFPQKSLSIESCNANWLQNYVEKSKITTELLPPVDDIFALYKMSYMYYTIMGTTAAIVVGLIVSYFTGFNKGKTIHRDLITPIVYKFLKPVDQEVVLQEKELASK